MHIYTVNLVKQVQAKVCLSPPAPELLGYAHLLLEELDDETCILAVETAWMLPLSAI